MRSHAWAGCNVESALLLVCSPRCPHSGTARNRAWRRLGSRPEPLHLQQPIPTFRWHAGCTISRGGIEKDSPMEAGEVTVAAAREQDRDWASASRFN
jgi:hypothetical protein